MINKKYLELILEGNSKGCLKCGCTDADKKDVAMTGTGLSKMFDVQHNQFTVVFCKNCGYKECYFFM